jgi:hypothetical protein
MKRTLLALLMLTLLAPVAAHALPAVAVSYALTPLGADNYRVDYELQNLSEPGGINELMMFFNSDDMPGADFPPLAIAEPTGWTHTSPGEVIQPDPGHYAWSIDWFDNNPSDPGVLPGNSLAGFSVSFHWSNQTTVPGSQFFEAFASSPHEGNTTVPEPSSLLLIGFGATLFGLRKRVRSPFRRKEEN